METQDNVLCCGCLNGGQRMTLVERFQEKQCFRQIICEIPMDLPENLPLWLCWECIAYTKRFTNFKQRVKTSYWQLQEYAKENLDMIGLKQPSTLNIHTLSNIDINPDYTEYSEDLCEIIKSENIPEHDLHIEIDIKNESDNISVRSENILHRDEVPEIENVETKNESRKIKKGKRKKVKQPAEYYKEIDLSQEEIYEERLRLSLTEEFTNAIYKCVKCIVPFPNNDDLKDHTAMKHDMNADKFCCAICGCSFSSEVSLNYHRNRHVRRYKCAVCKDMFTSRCKAMRHYEMYHYLVQKGFDIENCGSTAPKRKDDASETFPCPLCDKSFKWKTSLRKHAETHRIEAGQTRRPYCETCSLSFTTTSNLQKHVKTSSKHQIQLKLNALKCAVGETGASLGDIESIKAGVTSSRRVLACEQCGRRFQWRGNLQRHMRSHQARSAGELVCAPCNRTFSSIATYKQHLNTSKKHVTENDFQYQCSQCDKKFANKTRLKEHVDWEHLKNYVHTCGHCQKVFKSQTSLYLHTKVVHSKDSAEHLCDHCGKAFPNGAKLRSHIVALHSGLSPYRCGECGARFNWHSCLSRHVRVLHGKGKGKRARNVARDDV